MNKLYLYGGIAGAILLIGFTWRVSDWRADAHKLAAEIAQHDADNLQCTKDKALTKEANDELQISRDRIAKQLADAKRLHPTSSVKPSRKPNPEPAWAGYASGDGAVTGTSDDFRDYAAKCETYRSERITLEQFLDRMIAD